MDFIQIRQGVCEISHSVAEFIREQQGSFNAEQVEQKGFNDFVSYVDKGSEVRLVEGLSKLLPGSAFITEEKTLEQVQAKYTWIIDPLDGTTNFIHKLFPYAISVALMRDEELILGLVHEIGNDELFYADEQTRPELNGKAIRPSPILRIDDSLLATGFPYSDFSGMEGFFRSLDYFMRRSHGLRRLGSAATDLAYVACGRFEGFYEYGLSSWDVAAGAYILKRAGGKVSDFSGGDNWLEGGEILASNPGIYDEFLTIVKGFYQP